MKVKEAVILLSTDDLLKKGKGQKRRRWILLGELFDAEAVSRLKARGGYERQMSKLSGRSLYREMMQWGQQLADKSGIAVDDACFHAVLICRIDREPRKRQGVVDKDHDSEIEFVGQAIRGLERMSRDLNVDHIDNTSLTLGQVVGKDPI